MLDFDLGLANLDVVIHIDPKFTLHDVFAGNMKPELTQAIRLIYTGNMPADPFVHHAIMRRQLLIKTMPGSPAALTIQQIALQIENALIKP